MGLLLTTRVCLAEVVEQDDVIVRPTRDLLASLVDAFHPCGLGGHVDVHVVRRVCDCPAGGGPRHTGPDRRVREQDVDEDREQEVNHSLGEEV